MYLIYAEALNEAYGNPSLIPANHNTSAKDVLSLVRRRAGFNVDPYLDIAASNSTEFRALVKNERRIELCFSGERFHDLRRWNDIASTKDIKGTKVIKNSDDSFSYQSIDVESRDYQEKNSYLPLPYTELLINKNLEQNRGW